jgi:D-glycero-D-manno-heptose 1,7-bisphosphate phosphatase
MALRDVPAGTASALSIVEPMSATVFSVAFLNEKMTVPAVCGIVLILLAVFLLSREDDKKDGVKYMNLDVLCPVDYIDEVALADKTPKKVIFLDRDGTIHYDKVKTHKLEDLEYFSDTVSALQGFMELGYRLVIVTNQNGIAEGLFDVDTMHIFNAQIQSDLAAHGVHFDAIYYAPHLPEENHISYKPNCGMLQRAAKELNIDLAASYMIGDKVSDVEAGIAAGVTSIMVTTGIYRSGSYRTPAYEAISPTTAHSLTEALEIVRAAQK